MMKEANFTKVDDVWIFHLSRVHKCNTNTGPKWVDSGVNQKVQHVSHSCNGQANNMRY